MRVAAWRAVFLAMEVASFFLIPVSLLLVWITRHVRRARDRAEIELLHAHPLARRRLTQQRKGIQR